MKQMKLQGIDYGAFAFGALLFAAMLVLRHFGL